MFHKDHKNSILKSPKWRYIPWTGLGMVVGMYLGARWGLSNSPENYLVYSSAGLGVGLIAGFLIERQMKDRGDKEDGQIPGPGRDRYRRGSRNRS